MFPTGIMVGFEEAAVRVKLVAAVSASPMVTGKVAVLVSSLIV
jgi:hypothetical protein